MAPNVLIFLCWFSSLSSLAHELGLLPGEWYHIQLSSASSQHRDLYLIEMYTLEVYKIMSSGTQKGFTIAMMHAWHSHHLNRVPLYLSGDTCGLSVIVPIMLCINLQRFFFLSSYGCILFLFPPLLPPRMFLLWPGSVCMVQVHPWTWQHLTSHGSLSLSLSSKSGTALGSSITFPPMEFLKEEMEVVVR